MKRPESGHPVSANKKKFTLSIILDMTQGRTYKIAVSSFGLLNSSKPPSFHSPEGDINIELTRIFP